MSSDDSNETYVVPQEQQQWVQEIIDWILPKSMDFSLSKNSDALEKALKLPMKAGLVQCLPTTEALIIVSNAQMMWNDEVKRQEMFNELATEGPDEEDALLKLLPNIQKVLNVAFDLLNQNSRSMTLDQSSRSQILQPVCMHPLYGGQNVGELSCDAMNLRQKFKYDLNKKGNISCEYIGGRGGRGVSQHIGQNGGNPQKMATSYQRLPIEGAVELVQQLFEQSALTPDAVSNLIAKANISSNLKDRLLREVSRGSVAEVAETTHSKKEKKYTHYYTQNPLTWLIEALDRLHDFKEKEPADICRGILYCHFNAELSLVPPLERLNYLELLSKFMDRIPQLRGLWGRFNWERARESGIDIAKRRHIPADSEMLTFFDYVTLGGPEVLEKKKKEKVAGHRVHVTHPDWNNTYYPGVISKVNKKGKQTSYNIEFDDGDKRKVTEEQIKPDLNLRQYYTPSTESSSLEHIKNYMINEYTKILREGGTPFVGRSEVTDGAGDEQSGFRQYTHLEAYTGDDLESWLATGSQEGFQHSEADFKKIVKAAGGPIAESFDILSGTSTFALFWDAFKNAIRIGYGKQDAYTLAVQVWNGYNFASEFFDSAHQQRATTIETANLASQMVEITQITDGETGTILTGCIDRHGQLLGQVISGVTLSKPTITPTVAMQRFNDSIFAAESQLNLPHITSPGDLPTLVSTITGYSSWKDGKPRREQLCNNLRSVNNANQSIKATTTATSGNAGKKQTKSSRNNVRLRKDKLLSIAEARGVVPPEEGKAEGDVRHYENDEKKKLKSLTDLLTSTILVVKKTDNIFQTNTKLNHLLAFKDVTTCEDFYFVEVKEDTSGRWCIETSSGVKIYPFGHLSIRYLSIRIPVNNKMMTMIPLATVLSLEQGIRDEIGDNTVLNLSATEDGRQLIELCSKYINETKDFSFLLPYKDPILAISTYLTSNAFQSGFPRDEVDDLSKKGGEARPFTHLAEFPTQPTLTTIVKEVFLDGNSAEFDKRSIASTEVVEKVRDMPTDKKLSKLIAATITIQDMSTDETLTTAELKADRETRRNTLSLRPNFFYLIQSRSYNCYLEYWNKELSAGHVGLPEPKVALRKIIDILKNRHIIGQIVEAINISDSWDQNNGIVPAFLATLILKKVLSTSDESNAQQVKLPGSLLKCIVPAKFMDDEMAKAFKETFVLQRSMSGKQADAQKIRRARDHYEQLDTGTLDDLSLPKRKSIAGNFDNKRPEKSEGAPQRQPVIDIFVKDVVASSGKPTVKITSNVASDLWDVNGQLSPTSASTTTDHVLSVAMVRKENYVEEVKWQKAVEDSEEGMDVIKRMYGHVHDELDLLNWNDTKSLLQNRRKDQLSKMHIRTVPEVPGKTGSIVYKPNEAGGFGRHDQGQYDIRLTKEPHTRQLTMCYKNLATTYLSYSLGLDIHGVIQQTLEEENIFKEELRSVACQTRLKVLSTHKSKTSGDDTNAKFDRVINMTSSLTFDSSSRIPKLIRAAFASFDRSGCIMAAVNRVISVFIDIKGRHLLFGGLHMDTIPEGEGGATENRAYLRANPEEILMMDYLSETFDIMWLGTDSKESKEKRYQKLLLSIIEMTCSILNLPDAEFQTILQKFNFEKDKLKQPSTWLLEKLADIFKQWVPPKDTETYLNAIGNFIWTMNETQNKLALLNCKQKKIKLTEQLEINSKFLDRALAHIKGFISGVPQPSSTGAKRSPSSPKTSGSSALTLQPTSQKKSRINSKKEVEANNILNSTMPAWKKWIELEKLINLNSTVDGDGSFEQVHENMINMNNYTIMHTLTDGDCMYHAVLQAGMEANLRWAEKIGDDPKRLRQILIDALNGTVPDGSPSIQEFRNFVGDEMIPEMIQRITNGLSPGPMPLTAWGQSSELQLISFLYSVPITVVNQWSHMITNFQPVKAGGIVLYWLGNHYEWLRPNTLIETASDDDEDDDEDDDKQPDLLNVPKLKSNRDRQLAKVKMPIRARKTKRMDKRRQASLVPKAAQRHKEFLKKEHDKKKQFIHDLEDSVEGQDSLSQLLGSTDAAKVRAMADAQDLKKRMVMEQKSMVMEQLKRGEELIQHFERLQRQEEEEAALAAASTAAGTTPGKTRKRSDNLTYTRQQNPRYGRTLSVRTSMSDIHPVLEALMKALKDPNLDLDENEIQQITNVISKLRKLDNKKKGGGRRTKKRRPRRRRKTRRKKKRRKRKTIRKRRKRGRKTRRK